MQIAGSRPDIMAKCAEMLEDMPDVDMVDINMACPLLEIDEAGPLTERARACHYELLVRQRGGGNGVFDIFPGRR